MKRAVAITALCVAAVTLALSSCGGPSAAERKAEKERIAEAETRLAAWESKLVAASGATEEAECLRSILGIEVMELDRIEAAIDLFEKNEDLLGGDLMARVYLAVAQSKMAGVSEKIEDKLSWLRKGMASFESLREEYPDDESVFLYQASTYASFPVEVGAKAEVLDLLAEIRDRYGSGAWKLGPGQADQLVWVFDALRTNYDDRESRAEIDEVEEAFGAALPLYEAARQKTAEAERE